jgi:antitoxin FitA
MQTEPFDKGYTRHHVDHMITKIEIRNVPDALLHRLKARAATAGLSLSDYLLFELRNMAERPTLDELRARLANRPIANSKIAPARAIRAERDHRS